MTGDDAASLIRGIGRLVTGSLIVVLASIAFVLVLLGWHFAARAQSYCAPRQSIVSQLSLKYDESIVSMGVTLQGAVLEVLASPDGKTWTILVTSPDGRTCLAVSGEDWQAVPRQEPRS